MGMEDYHAHKLDKANLKEGPISCSMLKAFEANPYAWLRAPERQPTAAMQTGSLLDLALTEPETLQDRVAVSPYDSYRTKEAREWRDTTLASGILIADEVEIENAKACAAAVRNHKVAGKIMDGAKCQVGVVGEIAGIPAKCLIDILPGAGEYEETLFDYKTTSGGLDDEAISKAIGNFKYHWQAAFYSTLFNKVAPDRVASEFGFIFQDPQTREVRVVMLHEDALALGSRMVGEALKEFVTCAERGIKSRYRSRVSTINVPAYVGMQEEDKLIAKQDQ